jgi:hypothetical protein
MATTILLGARQINADTAGLTHLPEPEGHTPGSPVGLVPTEVAATVAHGTPSSEGLGFLTGELHPEAVVADVVSGSKAVVRATDSVPGRLGGLRPRETGTVGNGPAGAAAQARSTLAKIRSTLRI